VNIKQPYKILYNKHVPTFPGDEVSGEDERQKNAHVTAVDHHRQHGRVPAEHKLWVHEERS